MQFATCWKKLPSYLSHCGIENKLGLKRLCGYFCKLAIAWNILKLSRHLLLKRQESSVSFMCETSFRQNVWNNLVSRGQICFFWVLRAVLLGYLSIQTIVLTTTNNFQQLGRFSIKSKVGDFFAPGMWRTCVFLLIVFNMLIAFFVRRSKRICSKNPDGPDFCGQVVRCQEQYN